MATPVYYTVEAEFILAAGTGEVVAGVVSAPGTWKVIKMYVVDAEGITLDGTNFTDFSVEDASANEIGSLDTSATTLVAKTPAEITLAGTPAQRHFVQGAGIVFKKTDSGSGVGSTARVAATLEQVR